MAVTKAQVEALRWLLGQGITSGIRGGSFLKMYEERWRARFQKETGRDAEWSPSTGRLHAWRRTGGKLLAAMEKEGLVWRERWEHGVAEYGVTAKGRAAIR